MSESDDGDRLTIALNQFKHELVEKLNNRVNSCSNDLYQHIEETQVIIEDQKSYLRENINKSVDYLEGIQGDIPEQLSNSHEALEELLNITDLFCYDKNLYIIMRYTLCKLNFSG